MNLPKQLETKIASKISTEYHLFHMEKEGQHTSLKPIYDDICRRLAKIDQQIAPFNISLPDSLLAGFYYAFVSYNLNEISLEFRNKRCIDCHYYAKKVDQVIDLFDAGDEKAAEELENKILDCQKELGLKEDDMFAATNFHNCQKYIAAGKPSNAKKQPIAEQMLLMEFYEKQTGEPFPAEPSNLASKSKQR